MKLFEAMQILNPSENEIPYFLEPWEDYPCVGEKFRTDFIDRKLLWYYTGNTKRSFKERRDVEKQIKKSLKEKVRIRKEEVKKIYPRLGTAAIVDKLWKEKFELFDWQKKERKYKYINNLEYIFIKVFYRIIIKANLRDISNRDLSLLFYKAAIKVSDRLKSFIERDASNSDIKFQLPGSWSEGEKLISKWLVEDVPEFKTINEPRNKGKTLRKILIADIGIKEINKHINDIPDFAKKIHSEKNFKKANGSYYAFSSIRKGLYELLASKHV